MAGLGADPRRPEVDAAQRPTAPARVHGWCFIDAAAAAAAKLAAAGDGLTTYILSGACAGSGADPLALIAMPLLLSFGAALIAKWQQAPRSGHRFLPQAEGEHVSWTSHERSWKGDVTERIQKLWLIESRHAEQAQHRMMQHACLYGFATSAIFAWGVVANNDTMLACQTRGGDCRRQRRPDLVQPELWSPDRPRFDSRHQCGACLPMPCAD